MAVRRLLASSVSWNTGLSFANISKDFLSRYIWSMYHHHYRHSSSSTLSNVDSWVVLTDDKSTFIGWHPEPEFPYEHTKPLPQLRQELKEGDSVLKIQYRLEEKNRFRPDGPTDKELQKLTYTTKHRWAKK
ncbi:39S ribosomal protein L42, mitochondrial-like isoform X2 [Limulus polyphemus]|nr:39S ribosomal protein L42, mitochondrial-like isoform X2 [Limulus polyphemus]